MLWKSTCLFFLHTLAFTLSFHFHASFSTIISIYFPILGMGHMDPFETWSPFHLAPHILSLFFASTNIMLLSLHLPYLDPPLSLVPSHIHSIHSFYPFSLINSYQFISISYIHSFISHSFILYFNPIHSSINLQFF